MIKKSICLLLLVTVFLGNAKSKQIIENSANNSSQISLSSSDIASGLKEALVTGAKNSVEILGKTDGYYKDELVKIMLPSEADIIVENISKIPGGEEMVEKLLLSINRAAEDAVKDAASIFVNSITSMTITDAVAILKGGDDAATQYLQKSTHDELFSLYQPKIKTSVDKKLVGDVSTKDSWEALTGKWNKIANSMVGKMAGYSTVETNLEDYLTEKALEGLFLKIAEEEKQIRKEPAAQVTSLLKKVFGSVN